MTTLIEGLVPEPVVGDGGALAAGLASPAVRRPAPYHPGPQLLCRGRVHGPHVHSLAPAPSQGVGLWLTATVWRRLNQWARAGVFEALHLEILDRLGEQGRLDWSRACLDSMSVRARRGGTTLAQVRSIAASPGPSCTWSARGVGCR
jgi:hypothetical protein